MPSAPSYLLCVVFLLIALAAATVRAGAAASSSYRLGMSAAFSSPARAHRSNDSDSSSSSSSSKAKTVTFIRHGCTYMNEYLGGADGGRSFGSPRFTDVFHSDDLRRQKYQDSPLSPRGQKQARNMAQRVHDFVSDCELVVVSPLTRALQTFDIGLRPHFVNNNNKKNVVPVVALPEAAERLYLISDVGRSVEQLQSLYDYVDFETGFGEHHDRNQWWYHPSKQQQHQGYVEWRPVGQGQRYSCPGEPLDDFRRRMSRLHAWLDERSEQNIAVVCHHGVIESFLDCDFDNCQYRSIPFASLRPQFVMQQLDKI